MDNTFASRTLGGLLSLIGVATFAVGMIATLCTLTQAYLGAYDLIDFWYTLLIAAGLMMIRAGNRLQGWTMFRKKKRNPA